MYLCFEIHTMSFVWLVAVFHLHVPAAYMLMAVIITFLFSLFIIRNLFIQGVIPSLQVTLFSTDLCTPKSFKFL